MNETTDDAVLLLYGARAIATFLGPTERQVRHRVRDGNAPPSRSVGPYVRAGPPWSRCSRSGRLRGRPRHWRPGRHVGRLIEEPGLSITGYNLCPRPTRTSPTPGNRTLEKRYGPVPAWACRFGSGSRPVGYSGHQASAETALSPAGPRSLEEGSGAPAGRSEAGDFGLANDRGCGLTPRQSAPPCHHTRANSSPITGSAPTGRATPGSGCAFR